MAHFAPFASLRCAKQQGTVENGSIQNYRMNLAVFRSFCEIAEITGVYKRRVTGMERSGCLLPDVNQFHLADESQKQKTPGGSTGLWLETLGIAAITVSKASQGERIRIFNESTLYFKTTF